MNTAVCYWRNCIRASRCSKVTQCTSIVQRRNLADQTEASYKQYKELKGHLQIPHLTPNDEALCEHGIKGLYTPIGYQYAYTDWQAHVLHELNERAKNDIQKSDGLQRNISSLIRLKAKKSDADASIFNYASMAFNNHFYFLGLRMGISGVRESPDMSRGLEYFIQRDFESKESFKKEFLERANAMFAPGFVWLVMHDNPDMPNSRSTYQSRSTNREYGTKGPEPNDRLGILCTYGAGSPLRGAHFRKQLGEHLIGFNAYGEAKITADRIAQNATLEVKPLLCVSTWQHSYIPDYGVDGKRKFLNAWWESINWAFVDQNAEILSRYDGLQTTYDDSISLQNPQYDAAQSLAI